MEDQVGEKLADEMEFTPKAVERADDSLTDSCYTLERNPPKEKIKKKGSKKNLETPSSKTKNQKIWSKSPRPLKRLRKALSFSRSRSRLSMVKDDENEKPPDHPKPKKLVLPPAPKTKPIAEVRDPHPIPPNPTAAGSGRSNKRREFDLLSVEIQEMEDKLKRRGPFIALHVPRDALCCFLAGLAKVYTCIYIYNIYI